MSAAAGGGSSSARAQRQQPKAEAAAAPVRAVDLTGRDRQLRAATKSMARIAEEFARASRRTLPFMLRYKAHLAPGPTLSVPSAPAAGMPAEGTSFALTLASPDGIAWGRVALDSGCIAFLLAAALGGHGSFAIEPVTGELTLAQRALVSRIASSLAGDFARAVHAETQLTLSLVKDVPPPATGDVLTVSCAMSGLTSQASILLSAAAPPFEAAARESETPEPKQGDPRIADVLQEVSLEVVVELGRTELGLRQLLSLRPGDVVRLSTATDDALVVRVAGMPKLAGAPIVSRGQLAVEIKERHGR